MGFKKKKPKVGLGFIHTRLEPGLDPLIYISFFFFFVNTRLNLYSNLI